LVLRRVRPSEFLAEEPGARMSQAERRESAPTNVPHSLDAEQALIGAVLYDNAAFPLVSGITPDHFFEPLHSRLWADIGTSLGRGATAEIVGLCERFATDPALEGLGGPMYLGDLLARAPPAENAPAYAQTVYDAAMRRELALIAHEASRAALMDRARPAFEIVAETRDALEKLETASAPEDASMIAAPAAAAQAVATLQALATNGRVRGKLTGLRCVDRRLGGLRPGMLIVLGGRPSMGKTSLARAIVHGAAVRNPQDLFAFLGLEMGPEEMMQRELSALSHEAGEGVEYQAMAKGEVAPFDLLTVERVQARVPPNLILDDCHGLSVEDVRRKVWTLRRKGKLAALAIDYLQLMRQPAAQGRNESSVYGEMTRSLKLLARQSGICILLLSQLNRSVESRDDKRPQLSDLKASGDIEQDADAVIFPYREVYYLERSEPKEPSKREAWEIECGLLRRRLEVICAKQRQGPIGTDKQTYFAEYDFIEDCNEHA
jgi:replicative DNA helicase